MKYVLFVCTHNAGRSQMAQAFFEREAPADVRAESAGSRAGARGLAEVVEVMREVGIDLAGRRPRKLLVEMQLHADWAVTMGCGDVCPYVPDDGRGVGHPGPGGTADRGGARDPRPGRRARPPADRRASRRDPERPLGAPVAAAQDAANARRGVRGDALAGGDPRVRRRDPRPLRRRPGPLAHPRRSPTARPATASRASTATRSRPT